MYRVLMAARVPVSHSRQVREQPVSSMMRLHGGIKAREVAISWHQASFLQAHNRKGTSMSYKRILSGALGAVVVGCTSLPAVHAEVKVGLGDWSG